MLNFSKRWKNTKEMHNSLLYAFCQLESKNFQGHIFNGTGNEIICIVLLDHIPSHVNEWQLAIWKIFDIIVFDNGSVEN